MAANYVTVTPALAELISSLPQDEVPIKLRCAICSKLAVNAFRTPCCEQMALRSTCPVCEHTPISQDDCKPNKSLRMTTRAFLKTAEKKRDSLLAKESTPITPIDAKPTPPPTVSEEKPPVIEGSADASAAPAQAAEQVADEQGPPAEQDDAPAATEENKDEARPTVENENDLSGEQVSGEAENPEDEQVGAQDESNEDNGGAEAVPEEPNGDEDNKTIPQNPSLPNGLGFGGMNGAFPNMNFGGDFNQMQMMMAMQNGMGSNFGGFPMMGKYPLASFVLRRSRANMFPGMPGMGMDPSMMNMYQMNNGFGPGMDMSMMNGGMAAGFNGGMGSDGNWNGPQSWNNGQNNYNHPNAAGMGNGDYGELNSGYQTGYNQGTFGPNNQFNGFRGRGYYRGGRGFRGRGAFGNYGRGGFGYGQQGNFQGQNYMNQQQYGSNMMDQGPSGPQPLPNVSSGGGEGDKDVDEFGRKLRQGSSQDGVQDAENADKTETGMVNESGDNDSKIGGSGAAPGEAGSGSGDYSGQASDTAQSGVEGDTAYAPNGIVVPADPRMRPSSGPFGMNHQRGGSFGGMPPPPAPAPDVPLNAPKGPKAMRQGLPNTSLLNLRARGYQIPGSEHSRVQSPGFQNGANHAEDDRDRHRSRSSSLTGSVKRREEDSDRHRERSSSRSRAAGRGDKEPDRTRHRDRRGGRDRSESVSSSRSEHRDRKRKSRHDQSGPDDERDHDKERRHRHRSSKKHHDEDGEEPKPRSSRDDKYGDRSRTASPAGSRKSSHRSSRKERDSEKRRDRDRDRSRDRDRDDERDHKRKPGHRSHRSRERDGRDHDRSDRSDRDKDRDREREKDKDRDRRRDHDRDRDREKDKEREKEREKRRGKRSTAEPPTPTSEPSDDVKPFNPPTGPRGSISKNYSIFSAPKGFEIRGASGKASSPSAAAATATATSSSSSKQPPSGPAADRGDHQDRDRDNNNNSSNSNRDRDRDSRRSSSASTMAKPTAALDPHAAERERRNRERLLKETQRLAQFTGLKRRSTDDVSGGDPKRSRRHRRGGEVLDEDEEARLKRSEAEREGSRWG
ncbi:hypothetical protein VSDG_06185 [Cytospora chrysosperma]|uniref:RING-type domain-containing protein n=1 Tax=Cytospora chrysosperma TaxID=252740 RepID=A0A423VUG5_CYTCH|nr:hypothetical protein VSDG_06185 [Valsa sordida]